MRKADWAPQIATTSNGPIEYRLEGDGPTVLVLNGGHCTRKTRLSHERLARHGFRVLTPSRPGYDSTPSWVGPSAQTAADALAALLDGLAISSVDVIGISAAGPTALAFTLQYPRRVRRLVLESAVTMPWDTTIKQGARLLFGITEGLTWGLVMAFLNLCPKQMIRLMMRQLTVLRVDEVLGRMTEEDFRFVYDMIYTFRSGRGFVNDIEHKVGDLSKIAVPVLAIFSPFDGSVLPINSKRVAAEVAGCELFEVPTDSHLLWIGPHAPEVWEKRLAFLSTEKRDPARALLNI